MIKCHPIKIFEKKKRKGSYILSLSLPPIDTHKDFTATSASVKKKKTAATCYMDDDESQRMLAMCPHSLTLSLYGEFVNGFQ